MDESVQDSGGPVDGSTAAAKQPPPTVQLSVDEYQRLHTLESELRELRSAQQAALDAKEAERIKALADKGEVDAALESLRRQYDDKVGESRQRYADLERQVADERRNAVVAQALAGRRFVNDHASRQAIGLLAADVEVSRGTDGRLVDVDRLTKRPAADALKDKLDSPEFAHFFAADAVAGGAAQSGGRNDAAAADTPKPGSLEAVAAEFKARQARYGSIGLTASSRG